MIATLAPIHDELDRIEDLLDRLAEDVPGRTAVVQLEMLEHLDAAVAGVRTRVADARAVVIAGVAEGSSSRKAAEELGISLAAIAKASARAREVRPAPEPAPA